MIVDMMLFFSHLMPEMLVELSIRDIELAHGLALPEVRPTPRRGRPVS